MLLAAVLRLALARERLLVRVRQRVALLNLAERPA